MKVSLKSLIFFIFVSLCSSIFAAEFPDEYYKFRDDMYNFSKSTEEMKKDFNSYTEKAKKTLSGYELDMTLARYEFIMGRAYFYAKQYKNAESHYDAGTSYSKDALEEKESASALLIFAENTSANCTVKPTSWVMVWGAKIPGIDKKILKLDSSNGAALYMLNAQDVYAPYPFCNLNRGIKNMSDMLENKELFLDKDDQFNVISSIGYAYMQKKDNENAKIWLKKALQVYPGNLFVQELIENLEK
ncbi:MAG: hypothetical protein ACTTHG_04785 [Treponemataceae bacterium]